MSKSIKRICAASIVATLHLPYFAGAAAVSDLAQLDFFEKKIRPVLANECYECHSAEAKKLKGGLYLDTAEGVLKGGDSGPSIVRGKPEKSLLLITMRHEDKDPDMAMPPKKDRLSDEVLADFAQWIKMGAPDPRDGKLSRKLTWDADTAKKHWAFQKIPNPSVPKVADPKHFIQNPIDNFVARKTVGNFIELAGLATLHLSPLTLLAVVSLTIKAPAQTPAPPRSAPPWAGGIALEEKAQKRFDLDGNGWLNATERKTARETLATAAALQSGR